MLSKVLSGRALERVEPATFLSTAVPWPPSSAPPDQTKDTSATDAELEALRQKVAQLQNELIAVKRDSFDAGRRQGEQQARGEITPVIERMNSSIAEIAGLRPEMRRRAEKDAVQLALLIARRVLHRELNVDPNALMALARVVFERLARSESYCVTVHPSFAQAITAAMPGSQSRRVRIESDPACAVGTLVVRSEEGLIDASVDSQLEEITKGLTDRLAQSK
jgi:flagellar assembly protein FliH